MIVFLLFLLTGLVAIISAPVHLVLQLRSRATGLRWGQLFLTSIIVGTCFAMVVLAGALLNNGSVGSSDLEDAAATFAILAIGLSIGGIIGRLAGQLIGRLVRKS